MLHAMIQIQCSKSLGEVFVYCFGIFGALLMLLFLLDLKKLLANSVGVLETFSQLWIGLRNDSLPERSQISSGENLLRV